MMGDSQAGLIVTDDKHLALAEDLACGLPILTIESTESNPLTSNPCLATGPDTYAYILYTSGSTGTPKGVLENYRNIMHFTRNFTNPYGICGEDKILFPGSLCFSGSAEPLYMALLNGATLFPFDLKMEGFANLAVWLRSAKITVYCGATVFRPLLEGVPDQNAFQDLRLVLLGGDTIFTADVELFRKFLSDDCILVNGYGSTEMKQFRRLYLSKDTKIACPHVPVGYPLADIEVFIVDEDGLRTECGHVGEIAVQTRYIAPCYWRQPELTEAKFLTAPDERGERVYLTGDIGKMESDGCLMHLGRKDFQVKIRGYRIEIREIEAILLQYESVKEAVVIACDEKEDKRLVAYVVPTDPSGPSINTLKVQLAESLPDYMIPSVFCRLDNLPRTLNGKVDRLSLPDPDELQSELDNPYLAPRNPTEALLANIWAEILELDRVGVEDSFLSLGGHSLHAMRIINRTIDIFQIQLPISVLFEAPTVGAMANAIREFSASEVSKT
jgi:acyl-coenzyme A synthetase/AMP-(fatty) acid ligase/acyl carrier protein